MREGLVSAIIPVFNRADMLREAVRSVLGQTYRPVEVIVVDDGSTDDTFRQAQELAAEQHGSIRVLRQENRGPGAARNLGLEHADGEFVQFLDSDDLLEPRKFEWQVAALRENPEAGLAYGRTHRVNVRTGEVRIWARTADAIDSIFPDFLSGRGWDTNSPLWRRAVCDAVGPWRELRCMEDWDHDLRAGLLGVVPVQVHEHVATVRDHAEVRASGMNAGLTIARARDIFRAYEGIWQRMQAAGKDDWQYLQEFSSRMFWVARVCGGLGLHAEADEALTLSREMAASHGVSLKQRSFQVARDLLGWKMTERLALAGRALLGRSEARPSG